MNFGHKIKSLRNKRNWNVKDVAEKLKVHPDTVYKWERDQAQPRRPQLKELAKLFEVEIEFFFTTSDEEKSNNLFSSSKENSSNKIESVTPSEPQQTSIDMAFKTMDRLDKMLNVYQADNAIIRKENETLRDRIKSLESEIENLKQKMTESSFANQKAGKASGE